MESFYNLSVDVSERYMVIISIFDECKVSSFCKYCGRISTDLKYPLKVMVDSAKRKEPDFMLCGAKPLRIVSKRVVDFLENEGCNFNKQEVILYDMKKSKIEVKTQYYVIQANEARELDYAKMKIEVIKCQHCNSKYYSKNTWEIGNYYLKESGPLPKLFMTDKKHVVYINKDILEKIIIKRFRNIKIGKGIDFFKIGATYYNNRNIKKIFDEDTEENK